MEHFNSTIEYQGTANKLFLDNKIYKIVDSSTRLRNSTEAKMSNMSNVYYLNDDLAECKKYNTTMINNWHEYNNGLIPPYGDGLVIKFIDNNPYNLKWIWRTDGHNFVSHGKVVDPGFSKKYQNSSWAQEKIFSNPYVADCVDFNNSVLRDEIVYASWWTMPDIGALACTATGEYKICLRGPSEKNSDFKKWLISIINFNSLILSEDTHLNISIAISGGMVKSLYNNTWIEKMKNLFNIDSSFN